MGAEPAAAPPPLSLAGQRVLVLPLQRALDAEAATARERIDAELRFALAERDGAVTWIGADELRRALRGSPGFAPDPGALPDDPLLHHSEARAIEPLAGHLRRYAALTDTRLVVLPRSAAFRPLEGDSAAQRALRLEAAVIDARSGAVLWRGDASGAAAGAPDARAVATAAAELARRLVAGSAGVAP